MFLFQLVHFDQPGNLSHEYPNHSCEYPEHPVTTLTTILSIFLTNLTILIFFKYWTILACNATTKQPQMKVRLNDPIPQGFSSLLLKPYIKGVTHFQEVGWWRTWMVECVTVF